MSGIDHLTHISKEQSTKPSGDPCFVMTKFEYTLQLESGDFSSTFCFVMKVKFKLPSTYNSSSKKLSSDSIIHYLHNQTLLQDHAILKFCGIGGKNRAKYENEYKEIHP